MADFQSEINKLVGSFVAQVTLVAREAAMNTLTSALGASGGAAARRGGRPASSPSFAAVGGSRAARPKGAKRAQTEIEQTKERLQAFIQGNPGLRIEQINKELGTTTKDLALPLRKLIADGIMRSEGEKRSTQYFPADGKSDGAGKSKGAAAPKRRKKG